MSRRLIAALVIFMCAIPGFTHENEEPDDEACQRRLEAVDDLDPVFRGVIGSLSVPGARLQWVIEEERRLVEVVGRVLLSQGTRNFGNTIWPLERALQRWSMVANTITTSQSVVDSPDSDEDTQHVLNEIVRVSSWARSHPGLWRVVQATRSVTPNQKAVRKLHLKMFVENGAALSEAVRKRLLEINQEIAQINHEFEDVLKKDRPTLDFSFDDLRGVDPSLIRIWTRTEGTVTVPIFDADAVRAILEQAHAPEVRRAVYVAARSRGAGNERLQWRNAELFEERARLLHGKSHMKAVIDNQTLLRSDDAAVNLIENLLNRLRPTIDSHLAKLERLNTRMVEADELRPWDLLYFERSQRETQTDGLSDGELSEVLKHFPADRTLVRVLNYLERFGIVFVEGSDEVRPGTRIFSVYRRNQPVEEIGKIIFDLFSRPGKNAAAAHIEVLRTGVRREGKRVSTIAEIVYNFGAEEDRAHINLTPAQIMVLGHELGHALHALLAVGESIMQSGFNFAMDMVEVPSESLERFFARPETLALLSGDSPEERISVKTAARLLPQRAGYRLADQPFFHPVYLIDRLVPTLLDIAMNREVQKPKAERRSLQELYEIAYRRVYGIDTVREDQFYNTFHHPMGGAYLGFFSSYIVANLATSNVIRQIERDGGMENPRALQRWIAKMVSVPRRSAAASSIMRNYLRGPMRVEPLLQDLGAQ